VGILARLKSLFASGSTEPPPPRRLSASSEAVLAASIKGLPPEERGWITFEEARRLFSSMDDQYAFGEMDKHGKLDLGFFAAQADHRAELDFRPTEGRVYFTRKAN
jgi:hypothetical protein